MREVLEFLILVVTGRIYLSRDIPRASKTAGMVEIRLEGAIACGAFSIAARRET